MSGQTPEPTSGPVCHRDHWKLGRDLPMDRVLTAEGGWECYGIRPDRSGDCGFRIGVAITPELAAAREASDLEVAAIIAERNQLRAALERLASEDWLGTQGYDGDELQRRVEFARDKLAAIRPELTEGAEP